MQPGLADFKCSHQDSIREGIGIVGVEVRMALDGREAEALLLPAQAERQEPGTEDEQPEDKHEPQEPKTELHTRQLAGTPNAGTHERPGKWNAQRMQELPPGTAAQPTSATRHQLPTTDFILSFFNGSHHLFPESH